MKIQTVLFSALLSVSTLTLANNKFETEFSNIQEIKYNCADSSYGDAIQCYAGIEKKLNALADTIKASNPAKSKDAAWNNSMIAVNSVYQICNKINAINSPMGGADALTAGAACKVDLIALKPYKAAKLLEQK